MELYDKLASFCPLLIQYVPVHSIFLSCGICGTFHTGLLLIYSPHINVNNALKLYSSNFPVAFKTVTITVGHCCADAIVCGVVDAMDTDMLDGGVGVNVSGCVGDIDGLNIECVIGYLVGSIVGFVVGISVAIFVGIHVGPMVYDTVGELVGDIVDVIDGEILGIYIVSNVGLFDSDLVGEYERCADGLHIGNTVGLYVGVFSRCNRLCICRCICRCWLMRYNFQL